MCPFLVIKVPTGFPRTISRMVSPCLIPLAMTTAVSSSTACTADCNCRCSISYLFNNTKNTTKGFEHFRTLERKPLSIYALSLYYYEKATSNTVHIRAHTHKVKEIPIYLSAHLWLHSSSAHSWFASKLHLIISMLWVVGLNEPRAGIRWWTCVQTIHIRQQYQEVSFHCCRDSSCQLVIVWNAEDLEKRFVVFEWVCVCIQCIILWV